MRSAPDFYNNNIWSLMMRLALPGVLGSLLLSVNILIDSIYVSHLIGPDALAGVSLVFPFTIVISSVMVLIAYGSSSVLSRAIGAKDVAMQEKVFSNLLSLSIIASLLLTSIGYFFSEQLLMLVGGKKMELHFGAAYFKMLVLGTFFNIFGVAANSLIRAEGKIGQAMTFTAISVLINITLTPLLMQGAHLGVRGAALASIIGMGVYTGLTVRYLLSNKTSFFIGKVRLRLNWNMITQVFSVGLSACLLQLSGFVRQAFMFRSITHYGSNHDLALFATVFRIFSFSVIPVLGLLQSLQPIIGINYGAGKLDRAKNAVAVYRLGGVIVMLLIWLPLMLLPGKILSILLPGTSFSTIDIVNFRVALLMMPLLPIASTSIIYFQATGNGKISSFLLLGREMILFIPLVLLFPIHFGCLGVYYAIAAENFLYVAATYVFTEFAFKRK